jgi:hypothetical protein
MRSEELKNSQFLLDFLFEQDSKAFAKLQKDVEKFGQTRGPSRLDEYLTASGLASVQPSSSTTQFCVRMADYIDSHRILH